MIVDFASCLHDQPTWRDASALEHHRPAAEAGRLPVPDGYAIQVADQAWVAQAGAPDGVSLGAERGSVLFQARSGERAAFDPPRKVRAELCGARRYGKGEEIVLRGILRVEPEGTLADADWCSLIQIHAADTRRTDGSFVEASPIFGIGLRRGAGGGHHLVVGGEAGQGVPQPGMFSPTRTFAQVPFAFGRDYRFALHVIDGHGGPGLIRVVVDDAVLVDRTDVAVGYEFVDLLADAVAGRTQPTGSYLKMGVYAGRFAGATPPEGLRLELSLRDLSTALSPPRP